MQGEGAKRSGLAHRALARGGAASSCRAGSSLLTLRLIGSPAASGRAEPAAGGGSMAFDCRGPAPLPALRLRHLVNRASHAGGDAEDVASLPRGKGAPVIEASDARSHHAIEEVLLAELRGLSRVDLPIMQDSAHDDALCACWQDPDRVRCAGQ